MAETNTREHFELGDEPVAVERRERAGVVISVRLSRDEADRLHEAARRANKTLSQTAREAIVSSLSIGVPAAAGSAVWTVTSPHGGLVALKLRGDEVGTQTTGDVRELVAGR